jgi:glutathione synthase
MLKIVFQMDHPSKLNHQLDTTLLLIRDHFNRGHDVWLYEPQDIAINSASDLTAMAIKFDGDFTSLLPKASILLNDANVIYIRQDPPFNMQYITNTYLLERLSSSVLLVNDPAAIRNNPEKLFVLDFPEFLPTTLITSSFSDLKAFHSEHCDIIVKPLYGFAGDGVFLVSKGDKNLPSIYDSFMRVYPGIPMILQEYLPMVKTGDKRIMIVDGEFFAALNRVQASDSAISSLRTGATTEATAISPREREIIDAVGSELRMKNIFFAGLDVIGEKLTEINITCPTGISTINRLYGREAHSDLVTKVLAKLS